MIREETPRIAKLGPSPDIEFRGGVIEEAGIGLVPVLVRVGPERREAIYETWINHHADQRTLETLAAQPRIVVHLVGDAGRIERSVTIPNRLIPLATGAQERIGRLKPWGLAAFDLAREGVYQSWSAPWDLWTALKPSEQR